MDGVILIDLFVDLEGRYRIWLEVQSAEPLVDVALRCTDVDILCVCVYVNVCVQVYVCVCTPVCLCVYVCVLVCTQGAFNFDSGSCHCSCTR